MNASTLTPASTSIGVEPGRELSHTQKLVCDEVADMLVNGCMSDEMEQLLQAAAFHMYRRLFGDRVTAGDILMRTATTDWKASLAHQWMLGQRSSAVAVAPESATERIRANVIGRLREALEDFISHSTPEEHWMMMEMLSIQSCTTGERNPDAGSPLTLADTMEGLLGRRAANPST